MNSRCRIALVASATLLLACPKEDPVVPETCDDPTTLCTWAGTGEAGFNGDGLPLEQSTMYWPIDLTFTSDGAAYVLDWNNHAVRLVEDDGTFRTVIGTGFVGDGPDDLSDLSEPGADGTTVHLNHPTQVVELPSGKLLLVSWHNHKLREYDPDTGRVVVTCGSGAGFAGDGEDARDAQLNQPTQAALTPDGALVIVDMRNQLLRRIRPDSIIETIAGTLGKQGYAGDGGSPLDAEFNWPTGSNPPPGGALAIDDEGVIYVSDTLNHVIRRVDLENDLIETIAGTGEAGFGGDGGPATDAQLDNPRDIELYDGKLYIADEFNHRVRAVDLDTGTIETVAGNGEAGFTQDGEAPTETPLNQPGGIAFDADGNLYIADTYNHRIRTFRPAESP